LFSNNLSGTIGSNTFGDEITHLYLDDNPLLGGVIPRWPLAIDDIRLVRLFVFSLSTALIYVFDDVCAFVGK
jgi:hypothetical protein